MVTEVSHREAVDGAPDTERWTVDGERSRLTFHLRHIVVQRIQGEFRSWGGTLFVNRREPWLSSVHIWVELDSIDTGDADRDAHVLSNEFLDVNHFPRAEFKSDSVAIESGTVVVEGRLHLHGVVHDVQIHAHAGPLTLDQQGRQRAKYVARGVLDRQAFGLHWNQDLDVGGVVVGDEVEISAEVELIRHNGHHH